MSVKTDILDAVAIEWAAAYRTRVWAEKVLERDTADPKALMYESIAKSRLYLTGRLLRVPEEKQDELQDYLDSLVALEGILASV
jgi:hypothetical protein